MSGFEWTVVIGLGIALVLLGLINAKLWAIGHVLMDMESTQREVGTTLIRQTLPENHPFR